MTMCPRCEKHYNYGTMTGEAIAVSCSYMGGSTEITMLHQPIIGLCNVSE